jgi:hypothetical protein
MAADIAERDVGLVGCFVAVRRSRETIYGHGSRSRRLSIFSAAGISETCR